MVTILVVAAVLLGLLGLRIWRKFHPVPAPPLLGYWLDSRFRRWFQPARQIIERNGIKPGMMVMELGCGSGAFMTDIAREVGERGKVYGVDIQPAMLAQLKRKLARTENRDIVNVELRQASAYELPFPDGFFDLVYMVTVLPEIPDRSRALREVRRVLKPGGILAVSEFLPDPDYPLRSTTIRLAEAEGFTLEASFGNFWNYTVRFRSPDGRRVGAG